MSAWWDKPWNPVIGCTKCSPACDNCYAEALHTQRHNALVAGQTKIPLCYAQPFDKVRFLPERLTQPLHWRKPLRIFVGNMGDLFHGDVTSEQIDQVFAVMAACPQHTFMLCTKRMPRMALYVQEWLDDRLPAGPLPNVWLGTTIWDQASADRAVPLLLSTPAAKRFVSVEPMLGPVDLTRISLEGARFFDALRGNMFEPGTMYPHLTKTLGWVICGGETGPNARPMHPDWPRSLRDQCQATGVPFFFKQWGEWAPGPESWKISHALHAFGNGHPHVAWPDGTLSWGKSEDHGGLGTPLCRVGKAKAGRTLNGQEWSEVPHV